MVYENLIQIPTNTIVPNGTSVSTTSTPPPNILNSTSISILAPEGLSWSSNNNLSNGLSSRSVTSAAGIDDFTIVNPYIHYMSNNSSVIQFDPTSLLELSTIRFNIYSLQYRNIR